jgi:hypothetical protein
MTPGDDGQNATHEERQQRPDPDVLPQRPNAVDLDGRRGDQHDLHHVDRVAGQMDQAGARQRREREPGNARHRRADKDDQPNALVGCRHCRKQKNARDASSQSHDRNGDGLRPNADLTRRFKLTAHGDRGQLAIGGFENADDFVGLQLDVWSDADVPARILRWAALVLRSDQNRHAVLGHQPQAVRRLLHAGYWPAVPVVAALIGIPAHRAFWPCVRMRPEIRGGHKSEHRQQETMKVSQA